MNSSRVTLRGCQGSGKLAARDFFLGYEIAKFTTIRSLSVRCFLGVDCLNFGKLLLHYIITILSAYTPREIAISWLSRVSKFDTGECNYREVYQPFSLAICFHSPRRTDTPSAGLNWGPRKRRLRGLHIDFCRVSHIFRICEFYESSGSSCVSRFCF